jgi:hypothetical protein
MKGISLIFFKKKIKKNIYINLLFYFFISGFFWIDLASLIAIFYNYFNFD